MTTNLEIKLALLWETINALKGFNVVYAVEETPDWTMVFDITDQENGFIAMTLLASELIHEQSINIQISSLNNDSRFRIKSCQNPVAVANWINSKKSIL